MKSTQHVGLATLHHFKPNFCLNVGSCALMSGRSTLPRFVFDIDETTLDSVRSNV